ncbi:hypothetical protein PUNSTDRAFT_97433 [Punctularia strigosozonata HHB-11173 SS5]|uniref:uncharacterized protein n=1 Tax=Punctularia strigosozonata (strain HHB-11173) TaxID=741275 RepID=UPI0004418557|nr:uncharacterized protein PUNSTDRAFT_97433 [Punctularia strigosozonata HHB-11173 SS5]EIN12632.1 hypothetical protein PUNSTDRAFT_97433 [Punctularia strigosozonata HHB-11173 SS5]
MDRLCNEILQLVFFELDDPTPLIACSRRYLTFSQDPWIRASYFLSRYGRIQAFYYAFSRGRILTPAVIDVMLSSGALLSRYMIQLATHHYYRTAVSFIKSNWVRTMPFPHWAHLNVVAARLYGDIPVQKPHEHDGNIFINFIKESRFTPESRSVAAEDIRDILEKYKFIPFAHKDPLMSQFPLALSIEPNLLPLARANGFRLDSKYRDFVFRKMFEKRVETPQSSGNFADDIAGHVRDLCKLDPCMFLSRTVAAEVCMEAPVNEHAYKALKQLDKSGDLRFELSGLVEDLLKLFLNTRSITSPVIHTVIRALYADFPSTDPTVRQVILLTVFLSDTYTMNVGTANFKFKLEQLGLLPITRKDIVDVLCSPFVEKYTAIVQFGKQLLDWKKEDMDELVEEVAIRCLEIGSKGKMLKRLVDQYPFLSTALASAAVERYQLSVEELPSTDDLAACRAYRAPLCRDYIAPRMFGGEGAPPSTSEETLRAAASILEVDNLATAYLDGGNEPEPEDAAGEDDLGTISQDTLSVMIRADEAQPQRSRRRRYFWEYSFGDIHNKLRYPPDATQVGKWVTQQYHMRSAVVATFLTHAIVNNNVTLLQHYIGTSTTPGLNALPVTLKHFKVLARLGRQVNPLLFVQIERGAEFFFSEEDYLRAEDGGGSSSREQTTVKAESGTEAAAAASGSPVSSPRRSSARKRPRRSAAASIKSYAEPGSDDETLDGFEVDDFVDLRTTLAKKSRKMEDHLQKWVKHLTLLQKEEQKKYNEKRKRLEKEAGFKPRMQKNEFMRTLALCLRDLRKIEQAKRQTLHGPDAEHQNYSDGEDDEYKVRGRKRKTRA